MNKVGMKFDSEKTDFSLLPLSAVEEVAKVMTFGAKKYAPDNWRRVDSWKRRYFAAAIRHLWAFMRGERIDPESGLHHLAHAGCCVLFILELDKEKHESNQSKAA